MAKLVIALPLNRDYAGTLKLVGDRGETVAGPFAVAARALDSVAREHGNESRSPLLPYGDTPFGTYKLRRLISMRGASQRDIHTFGRFGIAVLDAIDGDAALADAAGRFEVWIHAGPASTDGRLRATNGSLRLSNEDQHRLMKALADRGGILCECVPASSDEHLGSVSCELITDYGDPPRLHDLPKAAAAIAPFVRIPVGKRPSLMFLGEYDSGTNFSNVNLDVIAHNEGGNILNGYVPSNTSGVTIGIGVDLSQQTVAGLQAMGVPQSVIDQLSPYIGLSGQAARDALAANPLTITADQATQLNDAVTASYFNSTGNAFDNACDFANFSDLPWQAQTVIADLWYNMGNLSSAAPNFWSQVTSGDWQAALDNLNDFGGNKTLDARAAYDATILQQAMNAGTLPTPH